MEFSHVPVLLEECLEGLAIRPDGIYLDGTAGGAGHSREIARRLDQRTFPGAVICLHDGRGAPGAPARTVQALEEQLPKWLAQGFRFQTMEHCL